MEARERIELVLVFLHRKRFPLVENLKQAQYFTRGSQVSIFRFVPIKKLIIQFCHVGIQQQKYLFPTHLGVMLQRTISCSTCSQRIELPLSSE